MALACSFRRLAALCAALVMAVPAVAAAAENQLVLHTATGEHSFTVELVDTPESRAKGLMFRDELADDAGMLFDFKEERPVSFWMQNTLIPLDMIFIDAQGVIKNIHVNARPLDPTGIPSDGAVQYVLEIAGGRSTEIGAKVGNTVEHDRIPAAN
jgi:uncharacterized membrane protein (UPF0127 family)